MEQKECNRCGEVKDLSEYTFHKKSGYYNFCKTCDSKKKKEYREKNKEKIVEHRKVYRETNRDVINARDREYKNKNKDYILRKAKEYRENNPEKIKESQKNTYYFGGGRERMSLYQKERWDILKEYNRNRHTERYYNDSFYRMKFLCRCAVQRAIKRKGYTKRSNTTEILGCSWEEFVIHLENNKYGFKIMDVNLDVDHIVPISTATTEEEVLKLSHHTNFQLLPSDYNRNIKSDKMWDVYDFEKWLFKETIT